MKKVLIIVLSAVVIILILAVINLRVMFNPYYMTGIPQQNFIEIRPIVYGTPTEEMRQEQATRKIILGGDAHVSPAPKYVILIKSKSTNQ